MGESYAKLWIKQGFSGAWRIGDTFSSALGALAGIISHVWPIWARNMSGSLWMIPIFALAAVTLFRFLFFAPYELWKREKARADDAINSVQIIGLDRHLRFENALPFFLTGGGNLVYIRLNHSNLSKHLLKYDLVNITLEVSGNNIPLQIAPSAGLVMQPHSNGYFDTVLVTPLQITTFPALVRVNFDYFYDTVPPTSVRRTGALIRMGFTGSNPGDPVEGHWYDEQREE